MNVQPQDGHGDSLTYAKRHASFEFREICRNGYRLERLREEMMEWPCRHGLRTADALPDLLFVASNEDAPSYRANIALAGVYLARIGSQRLNVGPQEYEKIADNELAADYLREVFDKGYRALRLASVLVEHACLSGFVSDDAVEEMLQQAERGGSFRARIALAALQAEQLLHEQFAKR